MDRPIVSTTAGAVRGVHEAGLAVFRGMPYAAPPIGPLRWQAPQPHPRWTDVRDAAAYGPYAPQLQAPGMEAILGAHQDLRTSEDCLTLNVWTPAADNARRPVLVWIHGGGFMVGSGGYPVYAGDRFARNGDLVVVTLNYRLGPLGYLHGMGDTANLWLEDQALALQWVVDNIAAFGGDPGAITLMGQSGGALSIGALLQHPRARGLFQRAILQSPPLGLALPRPEEALARTQALAQALGHDDIEGLRSETTERLLQGMVQVVAAFAQPGQWALSFMPVLGTENLPLHPREALQASDIDLLVGWTEDEGTFAFALKPPFRQATQAQVTQWIGLRHAQPEAVYARYAQTARGASPYHVLSAVCSDDLYIRACADLVRQRSRTRPVFAYEFRFDAQALDGALGSTHCLELAFMFGAPERWGSPSMLDGADPEAVRRLSQAMHQAWIGFVRDGQPRLADGAWPRYTPQDPSLLVFDDTIALTQSPLDI